MADEIDGLKKDKAALETKLASSMTLINSIKKTRDELQAELNKLRAPKPSNEAQTDIVETAAAEVQTDPEEKEKDSPKKEEKITELSAGESQTSARAGGNDVQTQTSPPPTPPDSSRVKEASPRPDSLRASQRSATSQPAITPREERAVTTPEKSQPAVEASEALAGDAQSESELVAQLRLELAETSDASRALQEELELMLKREREHIVKLEREKGLAEERLRNAMTVIEKGAAVGSKTREIEDALFAKERELDSERAMRRALEAKYDEKLKLKLREMEALQAEVRRLKKAGEQLPIVLQEIERVKSESEERTKLKESELRRVTAAFNATEAERSKVEHKLNRQFEEISSWEARVKKAEEIRWRAGMELAKAKAEIDWRHKGEQEREFHLERMKDEVERLKTKLIRAEMRKLRVEESLEECVIELRSKKREMEQMKHRVDGLIDFFQANSHAPPLALMPPQPHFRAEANIDGRYQGRVGGMGGGGPPGAGPGYGQIHSP
mmetsp:Transcript_7522/g.17198  ORF Transcript_7522/g.17198 Transcript_7522/m.17198 type:complete len:499 (+) Transcript_7522:28-1524(+)